ncbi:hypothetical protein ACFQ1L_03480 [Phytohabitans flavus]|uniref:hypothetical protein n=1 Tax=Phytohabitans flavus TaxID=1076124 RepID=UPI003636FA99
MRLRRVVKGLGALVILVGLLVGAPVALAVFAGNPLPDHVPALSEIGDALTTRDDGQLFLRALAVVGWLGWATFALSVLVEIPARVLRIPVPRLPGMRRQQRMAAALIGGVALIIGASPAMASAATAPPPTSYAAAPYTPAAVSAPPPRPGSAPPQQPRTRIRYRSTASNAATTSGTSPTATWASSTATRSWPSSTRSVTRT